MSKPNMSALQASLVTSSANLNKAIEAELHAQNMRKAAEAEYESAFNSYSLGNAQVMAASILITPR